MFKKKIIYVNKVTYSHSRRRYKDYRSLKYGVRKTSLNFEVVFGNLFYYAFSVTKLYSYDDR
jgi:hypothetical protein